jgi:hypothetical protein
MISCEEQLHHVRFQVLSGTSIKMTALWDMTPCSLVIVYRRFRGAYCLHHEDDEKPRGKKKDWKYKNLLDQVEY